MYRVLLIINYMTIKNRFSSGEGNFFFLSLGDLLGVNIKIWWRKYFTVNMDYFITRNNTYFSKNMVKWKGCSVDWKKSSLLSQYGKYVCKEKTLKGNIPVIIEKKRRFSTIFSHSHHLASELCQINFLK